MTENEWVFCILWAQWFIWDNLAFRALTFVANFQEFVIKLKLRDISAAKWHKINNVNTKNGNELQILIWMINLLMKLKKNANFNFFMFKNKLIASFF